MQLTDQRRFGVIKAIAWIYLGLGVAFVSAGVLHLRIAGQTMGFVSAIFPAVLALGAAGTLLKKQWGRYLSGFFSIVLLVAVPIGTLLGAFMLYHLVHDKDFFFGAESTR